MIKANALIAQKTDRRIKPPGQIKLIFIVVYLTISLYSQLRAGDVKNLGQHQFGGDRPGCGR
jgi:hypothetical protein